MHKENRARQATFSWKQRLIRRDESVPRKPRVHADRKDVSSLARSRRSGWLISGVLVAVQIPPSLGGCSTGRLLHFCLKTSSRSLRVEVVSACFESFFSSIARCYFSSLLSNSPSCLWSLLFGTIWTMLLNWSTFKIMYRGYEEYWNVEDHLSSSLNHVKIPDFSKNLVT